MIGDDGIHMTDAGYGCLAANLAAALEGNWRANAKLAQRAHGVAGLAPSAPSVDGPPAAPAPALRRKDAIPFN
jgi:hypothetical protein